MPYPVGNRPGFRSSARDGGVAGQHGPGRTMSVLAVIGGTGIAALPGLEPLARELPETPWGRPSGPVVRGRVGSRELAFLQRHGGEAAIPPHRINYRANLWALRELGVRDVIAINAVGGITDGMRPGRLVIPDQLIDYTWGREHTIDEGGAAGLMHVDFTEPYDRALRAALIEVAAAEGIAHSASGVYAATQGPRLETAAEIRRLARDGCDIVGMTGMPEAALARELGLAYASLCMVVNAAPGLADEPLTLAAMRDALAQEAATVHRLLAAVIARYPR